MNTVNPRSGQTFSYTDAFRMLSGVGDAQSQVAAQNKQQNRTRAKSAAAAPATNGSPPVPNNAAPMSNEELLAAAEQLPGLLPRGS